MVKKIHGGDIYRQEVALDFSVNINPLGMSPKAKEAATKALELCHQYPDVEAFELRKAIAKNKGVKVEQVLVGNGAAELIYAICYAQHPKKGLVTAPCFQEYEEALLQAESEVCYYDLQEEKDFQIQTDFLDQITEEIDLVFLCNPHNPTGCLTKRSFLEQVAEKCEQTGTYFCLDECFLPFVEKEKEESMLPFLEKYPHMIVLQAFTKIYGMPGLRLGYAISSNQECLTKIRQTMQPWNTSLPAQMAGCAAFTDTRYLQKTKQLLAEEKEYLIKEMEQGLAQKVYRGSANYLLFRANKNLKEELLKHKILIRSCDNYRNLSEEYFRIGIRTHEENQKLITQWKELTR